MFLGRKTYRVMVAAVALATLAGGMLASAGPAAAAPSKVFSASLTSFGGSPALLEMTITNVSTGSAALGYATIEAPDAALLSGSPTIVDTSGGKAWTASRSRDTIKLSAASNSAKLGAGEHVTVDFYAKLPSRPGTYRFEVEAKTSSFLGLSFTEVGNDPSVTTCGTSCGASSGNVNNPPPNQEVGSFTLDDGCSGCTVSISNTAGDFCSTPNPPGACKAPVVPQFAVDPNYNGNVTFILACDKSNCPPFGEGGGGIYPVYYTDSNAPTNSGQFVQILPNCSESEGFPPCVESQSRITSGPGAGDLQSTILLFFGGGSDPRPAY